MLLDVPAPIKLCIPDATKLLSPPPIKLHADEAVFRLPPAIEDRVPVLFCEVPTVIEPVNASEPDRCIAMSFINSLCQSYCYKVSIPI